MITARIFATLFLALPAILAAPTDIIVSTEPVTIDDPMAPPGMAAPAGAQNAANEDDPVGNYKFAITDIVINGTHFNYSPEKGLAEAVKDATVDKRKFTGFGGGGPSSVLTGLIAAIGELDRENRGSRAFETIRKVRKVCPECNAFIYHQFQGDLFWQVEMEDRYELQYTVKRKDVVATEYYRLVVFLSKGFLRNEGDGGSHRWAWTGRWTRDGQTVKFHAP